MDARLQSAVPASQSEPEGRRPDASPIFARPLWCKRIWRKANLLGAKFDQADLQAADLRTRGWMGVLGAQLAGHESVRRHASRIRFSGCRIEARPRSGLQRLEWLMAVTLLPLYALVWFRILTTLDAQLVKNASALPFARAANRFAVHPVLSFRPGRNSLRVSGVSSLHAARVGRYRAAPRHFSGRPEARHLPSLVHPLVRAPAFSVVEKNAIPARFSRSGVRDPDALLGRARDAHFILGSIHDATEDLQRHVFAHRADRGRDHLPALNFPRLAGKAFGSDTRAAGSTPTPRANRRKQHSPGCSRGGGHSSLCAFGGHNSRRAARLSRRRAVAHVRGQGVGCRHSVDGGL